MIKDTNSFFIPRGETGCLLIHGFSGSPLEMRQLGDYLAEREITVLGVRLAGHGTTPEDMSKTGWQDWVSSAEEGFEKMQKICKNLFVGGLSMGGAITLHLAANYPDKIKGVITLAGAAKIMDLRLLFLPLIKPFIKYIPIGGDVDLTNPEAINDIWSYDKVPGSCISSLLDFLKVVRKEIPKIRIPILIMQGEKDRTLSPANAQYIYSNVKSEIKELVYLKNSGHVITVDSEKNKVFEKTFQFIKKIEKNL